MSTIVRFVLALSTVVFPKLEFETCTDPGGCWSACANMMKKISDKGGERERDSETESDRQRAERAKTREQDVSCRGDIA